MSFTRCFPVVADHQTPQPELVERALQERTVYENKRATESS
jgi:hypothetical protein